MGETYDSVAGSAQNLFDQTGTPMQEMEANTRKLQQALVPLGEKIVELANVVLPPLVAIITAVSEVFGMLPEPVQNFCNYPGRIAGGIYCLGADHCGSCGVLRGIEYFPASDYRHHCCSGCGDCGDYRCGEKLGSNHRVVRAAVGNRIRKADGALGQGGNLLYGDNPGGGSEIRGFLLRYPSVVEQSVVADIRIFRQYLEQYQKYSVAGLERHQADGGQSGERLKQGVQNIFSALSQFISQIWNTLKQTASNIWNGIKTTVVNIASGLKDAAVNAFKNLVSGIGSALSGLTSVIKKRILRAISFITSLPGKALQWGKDFIQGLINGISSMIQSVINTVSGLADRIRSFLHFSAPDEGPLSDYETWMPDFMKGLAGGIEKNRKLVENAVKDVASDMVITPKVNASGYGYTDGLMAGGSMADMISGISSAVSEALTDFSGQQGNIVIPVYVGGTLLDELVVTAQARQNLRSGGR